MNHNTTDNWISDRSLRSLEMTDNLPPELRACVHEFGAQIVNTLLQRHITRPIDIRAVVHSCWMGAREPHQRHSMGTNEASFTSQLDWLLEQRGAPITATTLLRLIALNGMVIVPLDPSSVMVEASMASVSDHNLSVTKYTKHKLRLKAGIDAVAKRLWPKVFPDETNLR